MVCSNRISLPHHAAASVCSIMQVLLSSTNMTHSCPWPYIICLGANLMVIVTCWSAHLCNKNLIYVTHIGHTTCTLQATKHALLMACDCCRPGATKDSWEDDGWCRGCWRAWVQLEHYQKHDRFNENTLTSCESYMSRLKLSFKTSEVMLSRIISFCCSRGQWKCMFRICNTSTFFVFFCERSTDFFPF